MSNWYDSIVTAIKDAIEAMYVKKETGKGLFSGSYTDLTNKPTIPSGSSTATDIKVNGTQSAGSSTQFAKADHVHPTDTSRAAASGYTANKNMVTNSSGQLTTEDKPVTYTKYLVGLTVNNDGELVATYYGNQQ